MLSCVQVDAYIREVMGLPPREQHQHQQPGMQAAPVAAATDTLDGSEDAGRKRNKGTVKAEQVSLMQAHNRWDACFGYRGSGLCGCLLGGL